MIKGITQGTIEKLMKTLVRSNKNTPRILLIGAGRFGQNHLRVLKELQGENKIILEGVVVASEKNKRKIEYEQGVKVYTKITDSLLKNIDVVDIVTPPETHSDIASKCLKFADVFIEKPITTNSREADMLNLLAKKYNRKIAVGHIFRYDPLTEKLKKMLGSKPLPSKIKGSFINPLSTDSKRDPSLEFLHLFDVVDFIWKPKANIIHSRSEGRLSIVDIRYENGCDANFTLGWSGEKRIRTLQFVYTNKVIDIDFIARTIIEKDIKSSAPDKISKYEIETDLIKKELSLFLNYLSNGDIKNSKLVTDGTVGSRVVCIAEKAIKKTWTKVRPTVAIVGGGIFGTSVACELASFCDVTIFEKNEDIMQEATLVNCFRHHNGYHYPRSVETVRDIHSSRADFEKVFKKAIDYFPTYYGLAKKDSLVSAKDFIKFCKANNLPYEKEFPESKDVLNKKEISLSIRADEASYNHERMKKIVEERISSLPSIKVLYNTNVLHSSILEDGKKEVVFSQKGNKEKKQNFDFFINATYANINRIASWMNFEHYPIRVDLAEVLVLKLPIKPISLTVIDGPFATLMSTGNPQEFTLYHVKESILDRYVPKKGLLKNKNKKRTNADKIFKESLKWFPVLKDAKIVGSRVVNRGVLANVEQSDARVAEIINHGFGCWSILSGKILSSVSVGKRLANIIHMTVRTSL